MEILEKNKPPPPGPPQYYNLPLLLSLLVLVAGLLLSGLTLYDGSKTSLLVKCLGPSLVWCGTWALLLRILLSFPPSALLGGEPGNEDDRGE